jgi:hypothetical protein
LEKEKIMDITEMKIDNGLDEILTVADFMEKYAKNYPAINEEQFKKQLQKMEKSLIS